MDRIRIVGGNKPNGTIPISGAKNAALPLMISGLLTAGGEAEGLRCFHRAH
jgi:UDP-N-acetylglucosamine 1-carboxyvinyltransferase